MGRMTKCCLTILCVLALNSSVAASDWPQWRGPLGDGHAPESAGWIGTLPETPKVLWRAGVGDGLASPVVSGGYLLHLDAEGGKEMVRLLRRADGAAVWSAELDDTFHDTQGPDGPRNTPIIDGDRVYAVSCRGQLSCFNLADGSKVWGVNYTNDFGARFIGETGNAPGASRHGNNGSPLIDGSRLYACVGGANGAGVVCFDKTNGKTLWKSQDDQAAYAPPVILTVAGVRQLICFTVEGLISLDPETGALHWRIPIKTAFARHVTTPVAFGDTVVVSSHQGGMHGVKVSATDSGLKAEVAWISKEAAMNFSSPVAVGEHLYGLGPRKNLVCVEIKTGKLKWSADGVITSSADKAHAGFVVLGKNILCLTDRGLAALFEANPEAYVEKGQTQICGQNWCNPAYADGVLYARDGFKRGLLQAVRLAP